MKTSNFNFDLSEDLIAQKQTLPRDHSRLMVLDKNKRTIEHKKFFNLIDYLQKGDVLVFNNSKVFKARLFGGLSVEEIKDKKIEIFLLNKINDNEVGKISRTPQPRAVDKASGDIRPLSGELSKFPSTTISSGQTKIALCPPDKGGWGVLPVNAEYWQVLAKPGKKLKLGKKIYFSKDFYAESLGHYDEQTFLIKFNLIGEKFWQPLERLGHIPVPPYVKKEPVRFEKYQTVYAKEKGSVAAPTAGLHFTNRLIKKIKDKGVKIEYVTLHVGLGTFAPVKVDDVTNHKMHSEVALIDKKTADRINKAKQEGKRIIAVGTTATRVLETAGKSGKLLPYNEKTDIFIYPPYKFKIIDGLVTNFHLPQSTLLMLVSAFVHNYKDKNIMNGKDFIMKAYQEAISKKYRFFSFGDAMFIS